MATRIDIQPGISETIIFPSFVKTILTEESRSITNELKGVYFGEDGNWTQHDELPAVVKLKELLNTHAKEIIDKYYANDGVRDIKMDRGWHNCNKTGQAEQPHTHGNSAFVAVVYIACNPKSGDLMLIDARGVNTMANVETETIYGRTQTDRAFKRITPTEGLIVFFPAHLIHYVECNLSAYDRISIATNFG